jgi:hypothetical protein
MNRLHICPGEHWCTSPSTHSLVSFKKGQGQIPMRNSNVSW